MVYILSFGQGQNSVDDISEDDLIVIYLVENGADVGLESSLSGETALMYTSDSGHTEIVEYLESIK